MSARIVPKFVRYIKGGSKEQRRSENREVGLLLPDGGVIDTSKLLGSDFNSMRRVMDAWTRKDTREKVDEALTRKIPKDYVSSVGGYTLLAPMKLRRNVMGVGMNYLDNVAEVAKMKEGEPTGAPKYPVFFTKPPQTIISTGRSITLHGEVTNWLDYEVELGVVIGKKCANIKADKDNYQDNIFG
jgi:2-keto-4-pentenoate hydratase/2-oxohepta-3-ene-1,7-dioic acid hydratase in catechol pathway